MGVAQTSAGGFSHGRINRMILLDREVDMVTPMMTQITFEGLIDEVTGIRHGSVPWQSAGELAGVVGKNDAEVNAVVRVCVCAVAYTWLHACLCVCCMFVRET